MKKNNYSNDFMSLLGRFFTEYLPKSMNASSNTVKSYKCAFRMLFQYLYEVKKVKQEQITFEMLDFDTLTDFFNWLINDRKNSRTTAKQRIGALSSFAEYAQNRNIEAGYVFHSSLNSIYKKTFRRVKGKPRCSFTRAELEVLFSLPDPSDKIGWRDLVVLAVLYSSGARAQEICDLTVKDISHSENGNAILTLIGKGNKPRRVKITADTTKLLDKYIASRKIADKPEKYVFPSQRNEKMSVSCIEEIFEKYVAKGKILHPEMFISGKYTPHVMRHTTATHLIEAGVPLAIVKNILGHSSIQTTQVYLDISQQTVDRTIKEWNEKWFPNNDNSEDDTTKTTNEIPEFLW